MTHQEIRKRFLDFFERNGHKIVASSSLIPDDPSVLFTTAGMQQFKPYYTNPENAPAKNVASIQKCLRTSDIDKVGDESHLTFFEMMGNFSFGGYGKKEAIEYAYEFITKELGLEIDYVSVFGGERDIPADKESEMVWKSIDPGVEVKRLGRGDNFWGPTGLEGPCGPTTEIYANGVEVWNIVFNEYYCSVEKSFKKLDRLGVDTGMGLERLAMVVQKKSNIFETDLFQPIMNSIIEVLGDKPVEKVRLISDHLRASIFLTADGIEPSNTYRGYILRRLIRRALFAHYKYIGAGLDVDFFSKPLMEIIRIYGKEAGYKDLISKQSIISEVIRKECVKFAKTLENGLRILSRQMEAYPMLPGGSFQAKDLSPVHGEEGLFPGYTPSQVDGKWLFDFYQSFGFPFELTLEIIQNTLNRRFTDLDKEKLKKEFDEEFKKHQEKSRAGVEKKFGK